MLKSNIHSPFFFFLNRELFFKKLQYSDGIACGWLETMSRESSSSSEAGRLQALVSPSSLLFYTNDAVSHKQLLTIYNPHDFGINFKVYSTAPNKYAVIEPTGTIDGKKCIDM